MVENENWRRTRDLITFFADSLHYQRSWRENVERGERKDERSRERSCDRSRKGISSRAFIRTNSGGEVRECRERIWVNTSVLLYARWEETSQRNCEFVVSVNSDSCSARTADVGILASLEVLPQFLMRESLV